MKNINFDCFVSYKINPQEANSTFRSPKTKSSFAQLTSILGSTSLSQKSRHQKVQSLLTEPNSERSQLLVQSIQNLNRSTQPFLLFSRTKHQKRRIIKSPIISPQYSHRSTPRVLQEDHIQEQEIKPETVALDSPSAQPSQSPTQSANEPSVSKSSNLNEPRKLTLKNKFRHIVEENCPPLRKAKSNSIFNLVISAEFNIIHQEDRRRISEEQERGNYILGKTTTLNNIQMKKKPIFKTYKLIYRNRILEDLRSSQKKFEIQMNAFQRKIALIQRGTIENRQSTEGVSLIPKRVRSSQNNICISPLQFKFDKFPQTYSMSISDEQKSQTFIFNRPKYITNEQDESPNQASRFLEDDKRKSNNFINLPSRIISRSHMSIHSQEVEHDLLEDDDFGKASLLSRMYFQSKLQKLSRKTSYTPNNFREIEPFLQEKSEDFNMNAKSHRRLESIKDLLFKVQEYPLHNDFESSQSEFESEESERNLFDKCSVESPTSFSEISMFENDDELVIKNSQLSTGNLTLMRKVRAQYLPNIVEQPIVNLLDQLTKNAMLSFIEESPFVKTQNFAWPQHETQQIVEVPRLEHLQNKLQAREAISRMIYLKYEDILQGSFQSLEQIVDMEHGFEIIEHDTQSKQTSLLEIKSKQDQLVKLRQAYRTQKILLGGQLKLGQAIKQASHTKSPIQKISTQDSTKNTIQQFNTMNSTQFLHNPQDEKRSRTESAQINKKSSPTLQNQASFQSIASCLSNKSNKSNKSKFSNNQTPPSGVQISDATIEKQVNNAITKSQGSLHQTQSIQKNFSGMSHYQLLMRSHQQLELDRKHHTLNQLIVQTIALNNVQEVNFKYIQFSDQIHQVININEQLDKGFTFLMLASQVGNVEIVKLLLERNADTNIQNIYGNTALHAALEYHQFEVADLLTEAGAHPNILNKQGMNPWQYCN